MGVASKTKNLNTWRVSDYTPEYREARSLGKRKLLTPDEVLRLTVEDALVLSCIQTFFGTEITPNEKNVLKLSEKVGVTAAEIIRCMEKNINSIDNEADMMDKLYKDDDITEDDIITASRFSHLKTEILHTVSNLYLKKKIVFEY